MKKIFRAVAALAVVAFAGCTTDLNNEVVAPGAEAGKTTVTVGIADTKTYLGDLVDGARKVYWHNGDQIAINGAASTEVVLNEEKTSATFTFESVLTYPYSVLYPASMYKDATTITLPAVQNGATNNFAKDVAPMASYQAAEGTVQMHHLAGVIRLQVKLPAESAHTAHPLNKVETKGNAGEQMSGDFAIDYQAATLTATSTAEADKVVTTGASKSLSAEETDDVFIVVPAREYPQGITVRLIDKAGHYMDIASKAMTIEAGEIKAMPVVEFVPTGTLVGVEISSAEELIAFANAYNAGDYADMQPLNVNLTQDIVFDEATNAAWTPIGVPAAVEGEVDNYFGGYFNGAGFSIKNWNSVRPLFAYTSGDGIIENLTIDASCTLTPNYADESQYYGALVGYHRGTLLNCHVNANLTASGNWGNAEPHVGALVGRVVVGTVENCTVSGDVTITKELVTNGKTSYYGGAVARISNPAGVVKGVNFSGNVSHSAGSTYIAEGSENASNAYVNFGGIVGASIGTVTNCHLTDETKTFFYGNFVYGGTEPAVNNHYRTQHIGGIVGQVQEGGSVSDCSNKAATTLSQYNGDINGTNKDISRYLYGGGIVGLCYGDVSNCTMYANLTNRSSCLQQYVGGVVGNVQAAGSVSNCANEGTKVAMATSGLGYYQARNNNVGGVIGVSYSTALSQLSNKAEVACSRMNPNSGASLCMGGVIAKVEATGTIDGNDAITNSGTITSNQITTNVKFHALGGIIGCSKAGIKGAKNTGRVIFTVGSVEGTALLFHNMYLGGIVGQAANNITIESVTNEGSVIFNSRASDEVHYNVCVGGILGSDCSDAAHGYAVGAATIKNVNNSGPIANWGTSVGKTCSTAVGGIVGALTNTASSLTSCHNTGYLTNTSQNNTRYSAVIRDSAGGAICIGGVAGIINGTSEAPIAVTGCTSNRVNGDASLEYGNSNDYGMYALRGCIAGLIGGADYTTITNCSVTTKIYMTNTTSPAGIVCNLLNSTMDNCTLKDAVVNGANGGKAEGGLAGYVVASTLQNNKIINSQIIGKASPIGVLAGNVDVNTQSSFINNAVSGIFKDAAITLDSPMIGTGTPTVTGTTLYTE